MCAYLHTHVYAPVRLCIYLHASAYACMSTCICTHMYMYTVHTHMYIHWCVFININACIHVHSNTYMCIHWYIYLFMHAHVYTNTYKHSQAFLPFIRDLCRHCQQESHRQMQTWNLHAQSHEHKQNSLIYESSVLCSVSNVKETNISRFCYSQILYIWLCGNH